MGVTEKLDTWLFSPDNSAFGKPKFITIRWKLSVLLAKKQKKTGILYCQSRVWHNLLIEIINKQDLRENSSVVILDATYVLTEKNQRIFDGTKSLLRRDFNSINGHMCDQIIWINNIAFKYRNCIWIWIFCLKSIFFIYISLYYEKLMRHSFGIWHYITL